MVLLLSTLTISFFLPQASNSITILIDLLCQKYGDLFLFKLILIGMQLMYNVAWSFFFFFQLLRFYIFIQHFKLINDLVHKSYYSYPYIVYPIAPS